MTKEELRAICIDKTNVFIRELNACRSNGEALVRCAGLMDEASNLADDLEAYARLTAVECFLKASISAASSQAVARLTALRESWCSQQAVGGA